MQVTFNKAVKKFILEAFDKTIDEEGYLVEKSDPTQRVLTNDGQEIMEEEFGGIMPGSTVFIKNDLYTIMKLSDDLDSLNGNTR